MQAADRISNQPPVLLPYKCKASILFCVLAETFFIISHRN